MTAPSVFLNAVATAKPDNDIHQAFIGWARARLCDERERALFDRMAGRGGITRRWSVLSPHAHGTSPVDRGGFYADGAMPGTDARMRLYAQAAPELGMAAIAGLGDAVVPGDVTHLVVASCTGFVAPGIDQIIAKRLGLKASTERLLIGFMGCYAAVAAVRSARHIVRSDPAARVLVLCVELSSLHLQAADTLEPLLAMLQFGDGAAAAMVSADPIGFAIERGFATTLPESEALIRWDITDTGFAMHLSGDVPARIADGLREPGFRDAVTGGRSAQGVDGWAVHAGGRSILDAVARGLALREDALDDSRAVLDACGNMSSATLLFVMERLMAGKRIENGVALAFGPGLAAEGFGFKSVP